MSVKKVWYTYDNIHETVKHIAEQIQHSGVKYDAMIAIGGGGFIPARMLRCFLGIPIYTVSTAYYLNPVAKPQTKSKKPNGLTQYQTRLKAKIFWWWTK